MHVTAIHFFYLKEDMMMVANSDQVIGDNRRKTKKVNKRKNNGKFEVPSNAEKRNSKGRLVADNKY